MDEQVAPIRPVANQCFTGARPPRFLVVAVIAACALVRIGVLLCFFNDLSADPDSYRALAIGLHETGVYGRLQTKDTADKAANSNVELTAKPTAYRPPLYPWLLSWFVSDRSLPNLPIAILHVTLGAATCFFSGSIAGQLTARTFSEYQTRLMPHNKAFNGPNVAFVCTAFLVAFDPLLMRQSCLVMTETIATFLSVAILWFWGQFPFWDFDNNHTTATQSPFLRVAFGSLFGAMLGVSILCRPAGLIWAVLLFAALLLFLLVQGRSTVSIDRRSNQTAEYASVTIWRRLLLGFAVTVSCGLSIAPWVARNANVFNKPIATTTHGGYTLLLANNEVLFDHFETSTSRNWDEERFHQFWRNEKAVHAEATEIDLDHVANELALETIRRRPAVFAKACLIRLGWFWALWPADRQAGPTQQWLIGIWNGVLYTTACIGFFLVLRPAKIRFRTTFWLLPSIALVVSLCSIHAVYWSNMRMRAPCIPVLAMFAGFFAAWGTVLLQSRSSETGEVF